MSKQIMLEVNKLVKYFPIKGHRHDAVHAVDGVSFKIEKGRVFGLVGESGCGKSTCARTIIRIYEPTSGQIFVDGEDISHKKQRELQPLRRKIQMIFQDPYASLNARMTVFDIIAEPLRAHKLAHNPAQTADLVNEMLEKVGLNQEHASRYAHEFSGGQRQRIGVARALVIKPQIIICDEPISALDVSIQAQVVNLLKDFQHELGLTYLFIAHDLSMVRYVSDTIGIMYLGRLVEVCAAAEIYEHPLHPYTQGLLSAIPIPSPKLARAKTKTAIEGDVPSPISPPPGCHFHTRCPHAQPLCKEASPPLKDCGSEHQVACHLYK
jgi:oligopeptide transport system ATP-binding protein